MPNNAVYMFVLFMFTWLYYLCLHVCIIYVYMIVLFMFTYCWKEDNCFHYLLNNVGLDSTFPSSVLS